MASREALIDNIEEYTPAEIVEHILGGVISYDELCEETEGYFRADVRREVKRLMKSFEENDWNEAVALDTVEGYRAFMAKYPESDYAADVRVALSRLERVNPPSPAVTPSSSGSAWESVDKSDIDALRSFVAEYPADPHVREARKLINELTAQGGYPGGFGPAELVDIIKRIHTDKSIIDPQAAIFNKITECINSNKITFQELLGIIAADHNLLHVSVVKKLIREGYFTYDDLNRIGINPLFVWQLTKDETPQPFAPPLPLERINKTCTEVYFWGIPSSGKSCAIGAILNVAGNGRVARSMEMDNDCQGYGYMMRLPQLFRSDGQVGMLPPGTPVSSTYEMGFDLVDADGLVHPITFIDLAGELVRCMYKSDAGEEMTEQDIVALNTLTNVLIDRRSENRKVHFFVLEYGGEDRLYEGMRQTQYLAGALNYIKRTKIFKDDTDAIYLLVTKADKALGKGASLQDTLREYINQNYLGFYNGLQEICKTNEINGGKLEVIPFTLGEVCFQDYCLFRESAANNVVKTLLDRCKGFKRGKIWNAIGKFKR